VREHGLLQAHDNEVNRRGLGAVLVFVDPLLLGPSVREDLAFGLDSRVVPADEIARRVERTAGAFRLEGLLDKVPHYLSGGEKRKVALAGALVTGPDLVVLDEPFAGLDPRARDELTTMLREAHARRGMAVILATHEVDELADLVDVVYVLAQDGTLRLRESPQRVFQLPEVLEASNVPVPALARLQAALRRRGIRLPPASDPESLAEALEALLAADPRSDPPPAGPMEEVAAPASPAVRSAAVPS
jgi:cobalt/nickel transport system ATP-binding protein